MQRKLEPRTNWRTDLEKVHLPPLSAFAIVTALWTVVMLRQKNANLQKTVCEQETQIVCHLKCPCHFPCH